MSWYHVLPNGMFERGLKQFIIIFLALCAGFGAGLWVSRDNFQNGASFMQRAYGTPGIVTRETVSENKGLSGKRN